MATRLLWRSRPAGLALLRPRSGLELPLRAFSEAAAVAPTPAPATEVRSIAAVDDGAGRQREKTNAAGAVALVKQHARAKFDETVELVVKLGVDPRKPNQNVRGVVRLPFGSGKVVRVCAFAKEADALAAAEAGADVVGDEELIKQIQAGGALDFDRCVATPDMMPLLGRIARILGPRGMMPNPKLGTVTKDVAKAVIDLKGGQVQFRCDKVGIIHAGVGKVSFDDESLVENVRSFMLALSDLKPEGHKGKYFVKAFLTSTQGKAYAMDVKSIDPSSSRFML